MEKEEVAPVILTNWHTGFQWFPKFHGCGIRPEEEQ